MTPELAPLAWTLLGMGIAALIAAAAVITRNHVTRPERLQAGDCERCITADAALPCACEGPCGQPRCLAVTVTYAHFTVSPSAEELIAELMDEIDRGALG
jgi:hypothetical protein